MEVDYYSKYLKYKSKYTELKKQIGGDCNTGRTYFPIKNNYKTYMTFYDDCGCTFIDPQTNVKCDCTLFTTYSDVFQYDTTNTKVYNCWKCTHGKEYHK